MRLLFSPKSKVWLVRFVRNNFPYIVIQFVRKVRNISTSDLVWASPIYLQKAEIIKDRFREVVSDPLNILIERVPEAGYIDSDGYVILHNGNRVPYNGEFAYYGGFSDILIYNRGVHEPLEEFCFQEVLKSITHLNPIMIELGSYWAHYSMWFNKNFKSGHTICIEPDLLSLEVGQRNFELNGYSGTHLNEGIGHGNFSIDKFLKTEEINSIQILHADIQGHEVEMLEGAKAALSTFLVDYIFISTHSEVLHYSVISYLKNIGYRIEISSPVETHSTSYDGLVLASSPKVKMVFNSFKPFGRIEILKSNSRDLVSYISNVDQYL
jgi:hypothetical protein